MALARTASLAFVQGDHEAVRRYGEASLPVLRGLGDDAELAGTLGVMGISALALGDVDRARALAEEGLEVGAALGRPDDRSRTRATTPVSCLPGAGSSTRPSA